MPAIADIRSTNANSMKIFSKEKSKRYDWPIHAEKAGNIDFNDSTPINTANEQMINVSIKNCRISCGFVAPTTLRTEVSFALFIAPAVVRLI